MKCYKFAVDAGGVASGQVFSSCTATMSTCIPENFYHNVPPQCCSYSDLFFKMG